ncbi:MAG: phenylalanine--tRNA ligase subunit beta, partial [Bdellovibrionales bacterium]|nr:phenylalanine--tRNA ligase subunit beta [Bdellovibrionales bacterium]
LNSINNVVDVTNYILMELGQPLHAFDAKTIDGRMIIVGNAQKGEEFTTLDGSQIKLSDEELMIRDQKKSVALAGVMGGENSGVSESTTELFIESAYFLPESVRRASRKFGIESDSSYRFSRGIDPEGVEYALQRACALIQQVAGGEVCADHYDEYPQPIQREPIYISKDFIEQKLGYGVDSSSFEDWMKRLGCHILGDAARWEVTPPKYRWDLFYDVDLIEEYARLNGYENIPETTPLMNYQPTAHFDFYDKSRVLISSAVTQGFYQAMNYHFVSSHWQSEFLGDSSKLSGNGVLTASEGITLKNPLNEDLDVMRTSLLPGLFKNILHNSRHNMSKGALFEQGVVFEKKESFVEHHRLSLALWGSSRELWQKDETPAVLRLKSALENILRRLGCQKWQWRKVEGHLTPDFLHLGQFAQLFLEGKPVGYVGSLHPAYKAKYKLREDVALGDFDSEALLKNYPRKFKFSPLSKFPAVERDLAFLLPHQMEAGEVIKVIEKVSPLVQSVAVFDVFSGSGVADGMSSVAFKIKIQDDTKTLEEDFLTGLQKQIIAEVERRLSVKVRGE